MNRDQAALDETAARGRPTGQGRASRLFGYDFFISFALGLPPRGTQSYASDLARRLREMDFSVFFSEDEIPPGSGLTAALRSALRRSKAMVVIVNRELLRQPGWVRTEVDEFRNADPHRPMVIVNIDGALQATETAALAGQWLAFKDKTWLDESARSVSTGIVSPGVIERLGLVPLRIRSNVAWRLLLGTTVAVLASLVVALGAAIWMVSVKAQEAREEQALALTSQSLMLARDARRLTAEGDTTTAALLALEALPAEEKSDSRPFVREAEVALARALYQRRDKAAIDTAPDAASNAVSRDFTRLVSIHSDGSARLWSIEKSQVLSDLHLHRDQISDVQFDPNGAFFVTGSRDGSTGVWSQKSGQLIHHLKGESEVRVVAISPDGKWIATGLQGRGVQLWDTSSGRRLIEVRDDESGTEGLAFSPDNRYLATAGQKGAVIWNLTLLAQAIGVQHSVGSRSAGPIAKRVAPAGVLNSLSGIAFSPSSRVLVGVGPFQRGYIWDAVTGQELGQLAGHGAGINSVAFSPDGTRLVTASYDGTARIWDSPGGRLVAELPGHQKGTLCAKYSPDGKYIVTGAGDGLARIWDGAGRLVTTLKGHRQGVSVCEASADSQTIATAGADGARLWSRHVPIARMRYDRSEGWVTHIGVERRGQAIVTIDSPSGNVLVWDKGNSRPRFVLPESDMHLARFSASGELIVATGLNTGVVGVWSATTGKLVFKAKGHKMSVLDVAFSPDAARVASAGDDGLLTLWDVASGTKAAAVALGSAVKTIAFSTDGRKIVAGTQTGKVFIIDAASGKQIGEIPGHSALILAIRFSQSGSDVLVLDHGGMVQSWNLATASRNYAFGVGEGARNAEFDPFTGHVVVFREGGSVATWDAASSRMLKSVAIPDARKEREAWAFLPQRGQVLVATEHGEAVLLDVRTVEIVARFPTGELHAIAVDPAEQFFVTGGRSLLEWNLLPSGAQLRRAALEMFPQGLSPEVQAEYGIARKSAR